MIFPFSDIFFGLHWQYCFLQNTETCCLPHLSWQNIAKSIGLHRHVRLKECHLGFYVFWRLSGWRLHNLSEFSKYSSRYLDPTVPYLLLLRKMLVKETLTNGRHAGDQVGEVLVNNWRGNEGKVAKARKGRKQFVWSRSQKTQADVLWWPAVVVIYGERGALCFVALCNSSGEYIYNPFRE